MLFELASALSENQKSALFIQFSFHRALTSGCRRPGLFVGD